MHISVITHLLNKEKVQERAADRYFCNIFATFDLQELEYLTSISCEICKKGNKSAANAERYIKIMYNNLLE